MEMNNRVVVDTNILLQHPEVLEQYKCVLLTHVDREIEKHELSHNELLRFQVRRLKRYIDANEHNIVWDNKDYKVLFADYDEQYTDNKILQACLENGYSLLTNDRGLRNKAKRHGIDIIVLDDNEHSEDYTGVKEILLDLSEQDGEQQLANIYQNLHINTFNLHTNQYLLIWDKSKPTYKNGIHTGYEIIDKFKWNGEELSKLKYKPLENMFTGKIKPLNVKQELMFDMLQDKQSTIKATFGSFGVGKDFVMISHAVDLLFKNKIEKIVWVRNNVEVKDSNPIGFLPDSLESKLMPFAMPLCDHLGGIDGLETFLKSGKIEIQHLGFIRGRDIKNSIIYVTECENNTKEHTQLLIGRVGDGSMLWMNGDTRQIDHDKFKYNNGVDSLKRLKGNKLYGQVTLDKTERSETAKLADLLDE